MLEVQTGSRQGHDRLVRLPEVLQRVGVGKSALYGLVRAKSFPIPVKIGRISAWPESEVAQFVETRKASRVIH
jgi:prophage regulatory protein